MVVKLLKLMHRLTLMAKYAFCKEINDHLWFLCDFRYLCDSPLWIERHWSKNMSDVTYSFETTDKAEHYREFYRGFSELRIVQIGQ